MKFDTLNRELSMLNREDERQKERRRVAKRLKGAGMFTDEFISEIVKLDVGVIKKLKATPLN